MASFKAKFPVLQELFAKNHRGALCPPPPPPPSGARVNDGDVNVWKYEGKTILDKFSLRANIVGEIVWSFLPVLKPYA